MNELGLPPYVSSVIECAFSPVRTVKLPSNVRIVIGIGPDPAAEPWVEPPEDEDEEGDPDGEEGDPDGEEGESDGPPDEADGEEEGEEERKRRLAKRYETRLYRTIKRYQFRQTRYARLAKRRLVARQVEKTVPASAQSVLQAAQTAEPAKSTEPFGPIDPTKIPNFVCPTGSLSFGNNVTGGFCCGDRGNVTADAKDCVGGKTCAFPGNPKDQGHPVCRGGNRYACPTDHIPFNDVGGGFCCKGGLASNGTCSGALCAFPSNPRPNHILKCSGGSMTRDLSVVSNSSSMMDPERPLVQPIPAAAGNGNRMDVGELALNCPDVDFGYSRKVALRLPSLRLSWKLAQPVAMILLGLSAFPIPDIFGRLPDIAHITHLIFDYEPLPKIGTARAVLSVDDCKLAEDFGLVNITGTIAFDAGSGVGFDFAGTGVLPIYKSGIAFTLPLIADGNGMMPLTLATQDRPITLGGLLTGMKADSLIDKIPPIPLLSSGIKTVLGIQIKNIVFGLCKPGVAGCVMRLSINAALSANQTQFNGGMLPINIEDALATVSIINPFSENRQVELRITGKWILQGSPLLISVLRVPTNSEIMDMTDLSGDERRRRLVQRSKMFGFDPDYIHVLDDEEEEQPVRMDHYVPESDRYVYLEDEPEFEEFHLPSYDHWVNFPEPDLDSSDFSFFDRPLAHVNHHMLMQHRKLQKRGFEEEIVPLALETGPLYHILARQAGSATPNATTASTVKANDTAPAPPKKKEKVKAVKNRVKTVKAKEGIKPPPKSSGKWIISAKTDSLELGKILGGLAADLFPAGA